MKPKRQPPSQSPKGQGGTTLSAKPTPSASVPATPSKLGPSQEDLDIATTLGLEYDPPIDGSTTRRHLRQRPGSESINVDTFPWPRSITFHLPPAFMKRIKILTFAFTDLRNTVEKQQPQATSEQLDRMARDKLLAQYPQWLSRQEPQDKHPEPDSGSTLSAPPKMVTPTLISGAPLDPNQAAAPERRSYVLIVRPTSERPPSPTVRLTRKGERYYQPSSRQKHAYVLAKTVSVIFDGWPITRDGVPEQDTVMVDFICPSKTYMAEQVLALLDLDIVVRSDSAQSFRWQAYTGPHQWTTLTSRDDVPDFGTRDLTLRVQAATRRSTPPTRAAAARHQELWSKPWNDWFEPLRNDVLSTLGDVASPELHGLLFLSAAHKDFAIQFFTGIRSSPLYISLLDIMESTTDGYSWWSMAPFRADGDRVPEITRWTAVRQVTSQLGIPFCPNPSTTAHATIQHHTQPEPFLPSKKRKAMDPRPQPPLDATVPQHVTSPPVREVLVDADNIPVDFEASPVRDVETNPQERHYRSEPSGDERLLTTARDIPAHVFQTDVKKLVGVRISQARLPQGPTTQEVVNSMRDFRFYLKQISYALVSPTLRFPKPLWAANWILPPNSRPPWPKQGKTPHPKLIADDTSAIWYYPGAYSDTYPMVMLDFEAGLPSLPTFQHLASLLYLSSVAIRPLRIEYRVCHPTPVENTFIARLTAQSLARDTVCIDNGDWLQEALDSGLFSIMHPIDLHNRLNDITGCSKYLTTKHTDDVVSYADMRDRHNKLISWAAELLDPARPTITPTTPSAPAIPWFHTVAKPTLTSRDEVINQDKESPVPVIDVLLSATPDDDESGRIRITCARIHTCRIGSCNDYTTLHYAEPVTFRTLLFPMLNETEWRKLPIFSRFRDNPLTKTSTVHVDKLARDLARAVGSTVPHQKLQRFFFPGTDTR